MALETVARYGDESHIDLVSRYFDNSLVVYNPRFVDKDRKNQKVYKVQIGDLAMATMIHLARQKYRDFGMNMIDKNFQGRPLPIRYSGFLTDEERVVAKEKWKKFRASLNTPDTERN